jgi:ketosteroid isomerase-like protein
MSEANVEAARRLWERTTEGVASRRKLAGALADPLVHPDVEYHEDPRWPGSGVYRGVEAIQAHFEEYFEILGPMDLTLSEVLDAGDSVVLVYDLRGESVPTSVPFEHEWAYVWTFRDGRITEWRAFFDQTEALEAVGLEG